MTTLLSGDVAKKLDQELKQSATQDFQEEKLKDAVNYKNLMDTVHNSAGFLVGAQPTLESRAQTSSAQAPGRINYSNEGGHPFPSSQLSKHAEWAGEQKVPQMLI
mmetsp:Transcript_28687/g.43320  ORF Transcript_28687/g.43320 Transcript_28687/m.43320 type:complete len:105 (-) Transcript_28687:124-438(-)